jgi:hypothetical protein
MPTPVEVIAGLGIFFLILWIPVIAYFLLAHPKGGR